jgi:anti-sigma factor RsiW
MTPSRSPRALSLVGVSDEYAMWDAAYLLGSLSSADRREFEAHLGSCPSCREFVSELSGMPALLAQLTRDDVAAIDDGESGTLPPLSPLLLTSLLAEMSRLRRRSRLLTWAVAAAAAAVLVVGVFVGLRSNPAMPTPTPPAQAQSTALPMTRVTPNGLTSSVSLSSHGWGTRIDMTCTYAVWPHSAGREDDDAGGDRLAMVVIGRDGSQNQLATWVALTGVTATPGGSTSMPIDQIAAVQIVSVDDGGVLLQRSL